MTKNSNFDAELIIIPHDGGSNPRNPYDRFTPENREKKLVGLCARIYLRIRSKSDGQINHEPLITSSETPASVASDHQFESKVANASR